MEIITILMANIRHKKGSFVSILVLMAIISMALNSVVSVQDNVHKGITDALERINTGDVFCMIDKNKLSPTLTSNVKNHPLVRDIKMAETIVADTVTFGDNDYGNTAFLRELPDGYRLFNDKETGLSDEMPALKQGEIYISKGMQTNFSCKKGQILSVATAADSCDFKIAGIIEDPEFGASTIGWKNIFISHEDYKKLYEAADKLAKQDENICIIATQLSIYKTEDCHLTDAEFTRQINLDTKILDMGFGSLTKAQVANYTFLFPKTICLILTVFVILLLIAVVVIMCHSVSTGIEMEYTTLGIMKSQGFVKPKIQFILAAQYLLAQITGAALGTIAAIPLCGIIANVFLPITAIVPNKAISIRECAGILLCVFAVSALCIIVITRKIAKISPVRAIAGGAREIYFDSRLKAAISKKMLSTSLALRQFTSNKRQYLGVIAIVTILVYFMTTMMVLANVITATTAWESMGIVYSNLDITLNDSLPDSKIKEIEETIGKKSAFKTSYKSSGNFYFSINGEQIMGRILSEPEYIKALSKGRIPLYDNEIVITQVAADYLDLKIGDKVNIGYNDKTGEYIISGINQTLNDAGMNFSMTRAAALKLGNATPNSMAVFYLGYILEDKSQGQTIEKELNKKYGDLLTAAFDENPMDETYQIAIWAMALVVYVFSAIFSMVVVQMVCSKAFIRERKDIGIYKALGFTSARLRLQFAVRFSIVAIIGAIIGSGLAALFTGDMLSSILRLIGISSFKVTFHLLTFALPITLICAYFFLFAFVASGKIKKVEVRELISE